MQAHVLSQNVFGMPKVFDKADAAYVHIMYIILLEPGKFQSHPEMGVGIKSKYRFNNEENMIQELQNNISNQIETYLPWLYSTEIKVGMLKDHSIGIIINTSEGAYTLAYNTETDDLDAGVTHVLDELLI
jgi:hypothetical protein